MLPVLAGLALATATTHRLSVLAGSPIGTALPTTPLRVAAGLVFLGFAVRTLREDEDEHDEEDTPRVGRSVVAVTLFGVLLLAEALPAFFARIERAIREPPRASTENVCNRLHNVSEAHRRIESLIGYRHRQRHLEGQQHLNPSQGVGAHLRQIGIEVSRFRTDATALKCREELGRDESDVWLIHRRSRRLSRRGLPYQWSAQSDMITRSM